jgi:hypothetical protein
MQLRNKTWKITQKENLMQQVPSFQSAGAYVNSACAAQATSDNGHWLHVERKRKKDAC